MEARPSFMSGAVAPHEALRCPWVLPACPNLFSYGWKFAVYSVASGYDAFGRGNLFYRPRRQGLKPPIPAYRQSMSGEQS